MFTANATMMEQANMTDVIDENSLFWSYEYKNTLILKMAIYSVSIPTVRRVPITNIITRMVVLPYA